MPYLLWTHLGLLLMQLPVRRLALLSLTRSCNFNFILLDLDKLQVPQLQHSTTIDQLGRPRLPLSCVLLSLIDEQRLPSDMDWMFRQMQSVSSFVQSSEKTSRRNGRQRLEMFLDAYGTLWSKRIGTTSCLHSKTTHHRNQAALSCAQQRGKIKRGKT